MKPKICAVCKEPFQPKRSTTERVCSIQCAMSFAKEKEKTKALKEIRKKKMELFPKSFYEKKLESNINEIARLIDYGQPCISCGGTGKPQAGHYHSVGSNGSIRFNLHNIHIQDYRCNVEKSANTHGYDLGLIEIYGREYWEYVKFQLVQETPVLKLTIDELKDLIGLTRELLKSLRIDDKVLTPIERLNLRNELNEQIGIYIKL